MTLDQAQRLADQIREKLPEQAKVIDDLIAAARQRDGGALRARITMRLEKFAGEYEPGKVPLEVIESADGG